MHNIDDNIPWGSLNGELLPADKMGLPVTDLGFVHGAAVVETLRTFRHILFRPADHWERLAGSIEVLGIDAETLLSGIDEHAKVIVQHNSQLIDAADELGLIVFVTAGPNPGYLGSINPDERRPTIGLHTFRLPFELWANEWKQGQQLCVSQIGAMPEYILPSWMKYRSRLHWYLADKEVATRQPGSRAILADEHGYLTETSSGNLFVCKSGTLFTPPRSKTLSGISQLQVMELANTLGLGCLEKNLTVDDVLHADETFISSTSWCIVPVKSINGQEVSQGEVWSSLLSLWSKLVGLDIAQQITTQGSLR